MSAPLLHGCVLGAGPTGALAALALADAGWQVSLRDPLPAEQLVARGRAYAFTHSSRELLQRLDLWDDLAAVLVPFRQLHLQDLGSGGACQFRTGDLGLSRVLPSAMAVGWIAQHRPLMDALLARLRAHPAVRLQLGPDPVGDSRVDPGQAADLVVAADGPSSPSRAALAIGQWQLAYRQSCLTAQVQLRGGEADEAWELLRPEGPFAVLPLGDGNVQVVWSAPAPRCRQLERLPAAAFLDHLAAVLPDRLQPDVLLDQPRAFPVALQLARRLHRGRTLLVGESAHRCHPVGGQGLNLCWRDVAVLHGLAGRVACGQLAPDRMGAAYSWRRWPDLLLTLLVTDVLVRLFSNRHPLVVPLRRLALAALARWAPLRRLVLTAMTFGPCGGRMASPH
jgi:2-octaprenyl-6-methoxyphenol hydroxylase